jgi:hypothetical protein
MTEDPCAEARARVEQWEMQVEALEGKRDRAAMGKVIAPGVLSKLDAELTEAKKQLADAGADLRDCEAAGQLKAL